MLMPSTRNSLMPGTATYGRPPDPDAVGSVGPNADTHPKAQIRVRPQRACYAVRVNIPEPGIFTAVGVLGHNNWFCREFCDG
jgi:hypothetical protein